MEFNDRRVGQLINPAPAYRAGLKRPDKPGQASRAKIARLSSAHSAVENGHAFAFDMRPAVQHAPIPPAVEDHVMRSWMQTRDTDPATVLPRSRFARLRRV